MSPVTLKPRALKWGPNEPCLCGSGFKFKRCHGQSVVPPRTPLAFAMTLAAARERQLSQGLGRAIVSERVGDQRLVAVGNEIYWGEWGTLHTFLTAEYLPRVFGAAWMQTERASSAPHPLIGWLEQIQAQNTRALGHRGKTLQSITTGTIATCLSLAYDLFCIQNNAELQARLVRRLKVVDQFPGACYEARVAAFFVRAGFGIEFEDEEDGSGLTHCEFSATAPTGRRYSVECKRRVGNTSRVGKHFNDALKKRALHDRVIFIELDEPLEAVKGDSAMPACVERASARLRSLAVEPMPDGTCKPACQVVLTNIPWERIRPDQTILPFAVKVVSLGRGLDQELIDLTESMRAHRKPPASFDGQEVFGPQGTPVE